MADLEAQKSKLENTEFSPAAGEVDVLLHPNVPGLYRRKVRELEEALAHGPDAQHAKELIRSMIERVELHPRREGKGLDAMLYGDLAAILSACSAASNADREKIAIGAGKSQFSVVAGAGFEPTTFRL